MAKILTCEDMKTALQDAQNLQESLLKLVAQSVECPVKDALVRAYDKSYSISNTLAEVHACLD